MADAKTVETALKRIKKHKPTTWVEFANIGVPLQEEFLGEGAFRKAFRTTSDRLNLVAKFPNDPNAGNDMFSGKRHSAAEVRRIAKLRKHRILRPYLPQVLYHDKKSGVMVLPYYPEIGGYSSPFVRLSELVRKLVNKLSGVPLDDIQESNVRSDSDKQDSFVFIDLGY